MIIRHERAGDEAAIEAVTIAAFTGHPYSDGSEPRIIRDLRRAGALALSLVCEEGSDIIGHVALSPVLIDGVDCGWFGLGPISVLPDFQRAGIGSALMKATIAWMQDRDAGGCVLVGDAAYYSRFGFAAREALVLPDVPPVFFLALPLSDQGRSGIVAFHPAFHGKGDGKA
ncbi:GNAT family N-acetyltransferase [Allorhizobium borbori]|uniref:Putative acetyltransferase n=1 Tax=Allorhizobium borbori TaxID=485907 RepID=A0A7W6P0E6_9HYPH|nr:N-acetyltransferase [Allorhizobium borbori]MBB4102353.1 putative acetyltransferase [Allorhizobium borbori]